MDKKFNNANIDNLVKIVAKKLNVKPEVLRKQLEEGKFDAALKNMNPNDAAKFQQVLKNPNIAEKMMSDPQAQAMYQKLTGKKQV